MDGSLLHELQQAHFHSPGTVSLIDQNSRDKTTSHHRGIAAIRQRRLDPSSHIQPYKNTPSIASRTPSFQYPEDYPYRFSNGDRSTFVYETAPTFLRDSTSSWDTFATRIAKNSYFRRPSFDQNKENVGDCQNDERCRKPLAIQTLCSSLDEVKESHCLSTSQRSDHEMQVAPSRFDVVRSNEGSNGPKPFGGTEKSQEEACKATTRARNTTSNRNVCRMVYLGKSYDKKKRTKASQDGKKCPRLSKKARLLLQSWFNAHIRHPYPSDEEKEILCGLSGITKAQLCNWFTNTRARKWQSKRAEE